MKSYGFTDSRFNYEFDHLIPLEVGGHPPDVKNLFPEPGYGQYNFHIKDRFENYLHDQVCSGSMGLSEARERLQLTGYQTWIKAWDSLEKVPCLLFCLIWCIIEDISNSKQGLSSNISNIK